MRIRIRGPGGQSTISLDESATIHDLQAQISKQTELSSYDIKYGYPPQPLHLDQFEPTKPITEIGTNLNGEQLIISRRETEPVSDTSVATATTNQIDSNTPAHTAGSQRDSSKPLSLSRKQNTGVENDPPEVPSPEHAGTVVLRIMPDDNSCLFRAVGSAVIGAMDAMTELRSIVAQTIQEQPEIYSAAVLEKAPDDYCRWIQTEDSWGGGIELSILSKHFDIEICSIDVQSLRVDRFNEGQPTRCIVVYSGIHYDTIALSPSDAPYTHSYAPPEFDTKIFDAADPVILERAVELCRILQGKHYYTDPSSFQVQCSTCGGLFVGQRGVTEHAAATGHYDFGEAGLGGGGG